MQDENKIKKIIARGRSDSIRKTYGDKPISFHEKFEGRDPTLFPAVIRAAYSKMWKGKHKRIIIKAPRGGGKSKLLGTYGFDTWYFKNSKVVNMAGSEVQANIVYNYFQEFLDVDPSIVTNINGKSTITDTEGIKGNKFSCVTASPKQVRGKHPDKLLCDEVCETDDELIHAALPMVDTSDDPLVVLASTFHKIYGVFQDIWDNSDQYGYLRIEWDIFDVCKRFSPTFWDREEVSGVHGIEKLREMSKGRTGDKHGWINVENIVQAWREKPTLDWFLVEYMGSRPSAAGLILDPIDVDAAVIDVTDEELYNMTKDTERIIGIDWGFSIMTAVTDWALGIDAEKILVKNKNYSRVRALEIIDDIVEMVREGHHRLIYADSAGKFENAELQAQLVKAGLDCKVIEVVFSKEKLGMLGNFRAHFEQHKVKIPRKYKEAFWQYKRYRYQEGTDKPVKVNDHIPDSTMCAWQFPTWQLGQPVAHLDDMSDLEENDKMDTANIRNKIF